ncbi:hypothetical protein B0E37_02232 [Streptomyces sp. MH192]|nr:hypothetical protein [Streptomyces sp. MH192]MCF0098990.1 hypothetical protein [Streptomyces sp. MH191]
MEIGRAALPVPGGGQAPTVSGDLAALALAIDRHLLQHAVDAADRDSKYEDAPLHTAVTGEDGSLWVKTSATTNTWATVWEPTPAWRPLTLSAGMQTANAAVRRIGTRVHVRGQIERTDGTLITGTTQIGSVPEDCYPIHTGRGAGGQTITGDPIVGLGRVEVLGAGSNVNGATQGALMWYSQDGSGTSWVGVDFSYWID